MNKKSESLTAADFFVKLQHDQFDTTVPFFIIGMVKKSDGKEKTIEFAPGGNCSNWVTIPLEFIEDVEMLKTIPCKDHSHPLVKLNLKTPKTTEGGIFYALIKGMMHTSAGKQHNHETPERKYPNPETESIASKSIDRLAGGRFGGYGGGLGVGGGGLNAWGCWTGSCCASGHYTQGPTGWQWVCDAWVPCERCIWPY